MDLSVWIERHAAFTPDKAALRFEGDALSYAQLAQAVGRHAQALRRRGMGRGERVAFLGLNSPAMLVLLFACARLGAILVPLNWRLAPPEHRAILADAAPSLLVHEEAFAEHAATLQAPGCPLLPAAALEEKSAPTPGAGAQGAQDDPLLIVYTSGTTGEPKGAVLTQEAILWNAVNSAHMHDLTAADRVLTVLPLFHVGGLNIQTLPALHAGATVTLHRRFDAGAALAAIAHERPTLTVLVPAILRALIDHPAWPETDLSSLRMVATGSMIVPADVILPFHARGVPVCQVYGTTETGPVAVYQRREGALRAVGACGKAALHCAMRIVGEDGAQVAPGERGEVLIQGPNLASGYWRNGEATRAAFGDGWFRTGDIGHLDPGGDLWIDARKDDLIKSGGERVYPAEVEELLRGVAGVADVAVVGRPDPGWGEVPVAVVVPVAGAAPTPAALLAALEGRLARFKHPKAVLFAAALPKNALGKVLRFRLREAVVRGDLLPEP